jgi:hypothetical protein
VSPAPRAAAAVLCAVAAALTAVAPANAAKRRSICVKRATLRDSPIGFPIGYLYRSERVNVLHYDSTGHWAAVRVRTGRFGWVTTAAFCRKGR